MYEHFYKYFLKKIKNSKKIKKEIIFYFNEIKYKQKYFFIVYKNKI